MIIELRLSLGLMILRQDGTEDALPLHVVWDPGILAYAGKSLIPPRLHTIRSEGESRV